MQLAANGVLLDIEGTTSSVSFVYDVMFPFARRQLTHYLQSNWRTAQCQSACEQIARDAGYDSLADWSGPATDAAEMQRLVSAEVARLMDDDVKATGLKQLQGFIWKSGFESGELVAHVFDDVPPALIRFNANGLDVRVYSSGSIHAQTLFFGHTEYGNLLKHFRGHYDTTTGPKKQAASYSAIAADFALPPREIVFVSDVVAELDAARDCGMQTCLCQRPGNALVQAGHGHAVLTNFTQLEFV